MSNEMAVTDNVAGDDAKVKNKETNVDTEEGAPSPPLKQESESSDIKNEAPSVSQEPILEETEQKDDIQVSIKNADDKEKDVTEEKMESVEETVVQDDANKTETIDPVKVTVSVQLENMDNEENEDVENKIDTKDIAETEIKEEPVVDIKEEIKADDTAKEEEVEVKKEQKAIKRRASEAFSDDMDSEEFKGFNLQDKDSNPTGYDRILERLEEEISTATKNLKPLRNVLIAFSTTGRASKRPRKDTDGSRPSSAMSSRSDEMNDLTSAMSPMQKSRRSTTEISSPLLRIPLERGWKRELVYRAALDAHSRRNADIYYYMPSGKKLRSTREIAEHLSGTGLTLENFSFFKEPLGVDDPEKEIIRDAKMIRRVDSPVVAPAPPAPLEGKRTPKPKPPKGASPEPATPKSPPSKIKVKSYGSRLSGAAATPPAAAPAKQLRRQQLQQNQPQQSPATTNNADNNNTAAWKKPRAPEAPAPAAQTPAAGAPVPPQVGMPPQQLPSLQPPPLQSRPPPIDQTSPDAQGGRQLVQPCSMMCGRGAVPSLSCAACLCLYHPACAGYHPAHTAPKPFLCANCLKVSPPLEPPPLVHKSGVAIASGAVAAPVPRRVPAPAKVPRGDKRVLLRMKVAGGTEGERVWSVSPSSPAQSPPPASPVCTATPPAAQAGAAQAAAAGGGRGSRGALPQFLAQFNGRRFIVVPRTILHAAQQHEEKRRGRIANGASSPPQPAPAPAPAPAVAVTAAPAATTAATASASVVTASPRRRGRPRNDDTDYFTPFYNRALERNYNVVVQIFQYLGMRELAQCARVCKLWRQLAATPALWRHVRMKNSHVSNWAGLCSALSKHGTKRLDLRKMLLPQNDAPFWSEFAQNISTVSSLERIEMCRCPSSAVEAVCNGLPGLRALSALAIRDALLDPAPLAALTLLHELRLKSMAGLSLTRDLKPLAALSRLQHLSLTSIKDLGWCACEVVGSLSQLESLELGECSFRADMSGALSRLTRLRRLRLERGPALHAAPPVLRALAALPALHSLELVNVDVKVGFDDALAECKNIQRLLIIPTYVSQSATTNKQVLNGVLRLKETLTHLMWGVTIELLRVTELFIDQCEQAGEAKRRDVGECIPVLKPVPGCKLPVDRHHVNGPPQVEILPLPTLQRLLSAQMPNTKLKLLRIPFHATWRQSLTDFQ